MLSGNCAKSWIDEGLNLGALPTIADEYIFNWGGDLQYNRFAHICRFISARVVIPGSPTICGVSFPPTGTCKNIIHQQEVLEQLTQLQLLLSCRLYLQTVLTSCDNQHWSSQIILQPISSCEWWWGSTRVYDLSQFNAAARTYWFDLISIGAKSIHLCWW